MAHTPSKPTPRRETAAVELARTAPEKLYDASYYKDGCSGDGTVEYGRKEPWLTFFRNVARKIKKTHEPRTVADVGCAFGLLTEALVDLGVDAYGFDISPYAIGQARADMKDRLFVHPITEPIPRLAGGEKYDLTICIEVLEHLPPEMADTAVRNLCDSADRILFSSSPDDFDEPTHFNILPTEAWLAKFAEHGFVPSPSHPEAPYIAPQARVVERVGAAERRGPWLHRLLGRFLKRR